MSLRASQFEAIQSTAWRGKPCSYSEAVLHLVEEISTARGKLAGLQFFNPEDFVGQPYANLLESRGFHGWIIHEWAITGGRYSNNGGGAAIQPGDGGGVIFAGPPGEKPAPIMLIRLREDPPDPPAAALMLATIYHELGHVDDFTRGVNMRIGKSWNVVNIESFAHLAAIHSLTVERHALALYLYLAELAEMPRRHAGSGYGAAAEVALADSSCAAARSFLNSTIAGMGDHALRPRDP